MLRPTKCSILIIACQLPCLVTQSQSNVALQSQLVPPKMLIGVACHTASCCAGGKAYLQERKLSYNKQTQH